METTMPPLPYLKRIPGLDMVAAEAPHPAIT